MSLEIARKRAKKFFQYHNLSIPVKVKDLLARYADIKEEYIPLDGEAICINNKEKPVIIIKSNMATMRKRFTYAHELAHLQIPSHTGMISCTTEFLDPIDLTEYEQMEQEANAFAAELLMPTNWLSTLIPQYKDNFPALIETICEQAMVSVPAAVYNIIPLLHENYIFKITDKIKGFSYIKTCDNYTKPFMLENADFSVDEDWLELSCIKTDFADYDALSVKTFYFKRTPNEELMKKLGNAFSDPQKCILACEYITSADNMSFAHLFKSIKDYLLPGTILKIKSTLSNNFKYIFAPDTYIKALYQNDTDADMWYNENCIFSAVSQRSHMVISIWYFLTNFTIIGDYNDPRDSKTIMRNIIDCYDLDKSKRDSLLGSINGIIGSVNSSFHNYTKQAFYNVLRQKFISRKDLKFIVDNFDFNQFLFRKTDEIYKKKEALKEN